MKMVIYDYNVAYIVYIHTARENVDKEYNDNRYLRILVLRKMVDSK